MNTEVLSIVNPFDNNHLVKIDNFEKENEIGTKTSDFLTKLKESMTKEEYELQKKSSNDIETSLFLEMDDSVKDVCHIKGEKDRKTCTITFAEIKTKLRNRRMITLATDYALNSLGMEEVFVSIDKEDKNMIMNLEARGFESLGEESGIIIYLKEKELIKEPLRVI